MKNEVPPFDPDFPEMSRPKPRPPRRVPWLAIIVLLVLGGGGAVGWKMLGRGGSAAGGDPARDMMRAELMELSAAESAFVKANDRYAASVSELGRPVSSRVVVFASARDGYRIRLARPDDTAQLCELSVGRFAAGHTGWQLLCGMPSANNTLVETAPSKPPLLDRIRAYFHEDCDSECRVEKLREEVRRRRGHDKVERAMERL
ncbi:MAG TPA: hypothetical protein VHM30_17135, partial [Gemmatimonadaceae bacterium]|nr:hypothetical protein [Gemmatimonadaceae bacterium]